MKVKFAIYIQNNGDGSASTKSFKDKVTAEAYAEKDGDERFCDDICVKELEFDEDGDGNFHLIEN